VSDAPRFYLAADAQGAIRLWERRPRGGDRMLARRFASFAEAAAFRAALLDGAPTLHPDDPQWRIDHGMG